MMMTQQKGTKMAIRENGLKSIDSNYEVGSDETNERTSLLKKQASWYSSHSTAWLTDESSDAGQSGHYEFQLYSQRWIQLAYLSLLALLSDWICFSVASCPEAFEEAYPGHSAETLITIFLATNVVTSFFVTDLVARFGLQRTVQGAAVIMTIGCWMRSGFGCFAAGGPSLHLMPFPAVVVGTILVGAAQPFFQCTPPVTSATWFAPTERAGATAVALNFNQMGIATAYLVFGYMSKKGMTGLIHYFGLISVACSAVCFGTLWQYENEPPTPPSMSELEKKQRGHQEQPFLQSVRVLFETRGFSHALAAFICSISITNVVGAFIGDITARVGITDQFQVGLCGAVFEVSIVLGGIVLGGFVDKTKLYKKTILVCLAVCAILVVPLGFTDYAIGASPFLLVLALTGLGLSAGPVQPISAELAVDVTYPGDETAVESVQQIGGNLVSAVLVPLVKRCAMAVFLLFSSSSWAASDLSGDVVLLAGLAIATFIYFVTFDAPLARTLADEEEDKASPTIEALGLDV